MDKNHDTRVGTGNKTRSPDLFPKPMRKPPRVLMHVCDAGNSCDPDFPLWVEMECKTCRHRAQFVCQTITEAKRGFECPKCADAMRHKALPPIPRTPSP